MRAIRCFAGACLAAAAFGTWAGPAAVVSDFSANRDGWITADLLGLSAPALPTWESGGYISTMDTHSWNVFAAPAKFLGDKSAYAGGTLSFSLADSLNDGSPARWPLAFLVSGSTVLAAWPYANPGTTAFTDFSLRLEASAWVDASLSPVSTATFNGVLHNLSGLYVNADFKVRGDDYARLDNVVLAAVPEPAEAVLLGVGLAGLALQARRARGR